ncbi:hypothetical protein [Nonomuraea sp. NPDC001699]
MYVWTPHVPYGPRPVRVREISCCGEYEWCCEAGQFLIRRHSEENGYEETARGRHATARLVWATLLAGHRHGQPKR